jgi:hypothetical protein
MIILTTLTLMLIAGILTAKYTYTEFLSVVLVGAGSIGLLLGVICLPIAHMDYNSQIQEFNSVKATLENARENNVEKIESAAFQLKIADKNEWLASMKYYNGTVFDLWIPDEIDALEPIE